MAIEFFTREKKKADWLNENDVRIMVKPRTNKDGFLFDLTIKNEWLDKISKTDYMELGMDYDNGRLYFRGCIDKQGWRFRRCNTTANTRIVNDRLVKFAEKYEGEYKILFDNQRGFYYVNCDSLDWIDKTFKM